MPIVSRKNKENLTAVGVVAREGYCTGRKQQKKNNNKEQWKLGQEVM